MAPLTKERNTPRMGIGPVVDVLEIPMAANTTIYQGSLVAVNASGFAVPGAVATTLKAAGRAQVTATNGATAGATKIRVERGTFRFNNSTAGDLIVQADLLNNAYILDDATVAKTHGTNTRSIAGRILGVDSVGVWLEIV